MYYGSIKKNDIANGEGVRISLFVSGCLNKCEGCFQPETWDFEYGQPFGCGEQKRILELLEPYYVDGFTVLGGEPFEPQNQRDLLPLLKKIKEKYPHKTVWAFTGFTLDEMKEDGCRAKCECTEPILDLIDVLVDGPYKDELRDLSLQFRGSSNQRLIDMNETRKSGEIVIWGEE